VAHIDDVELVAAMSPNRAGDVEAEPPRTCLKRSAPA